LLVWDRFILPRLIDLVMRNKAESAERARLVPLAAGRVLEIGIGSALNVPYYISDLRCLVGVDPSQELWRIGRRRLRVSAFPIHYVTASAEKLPLADRCVDTILTTWTLCSIPNVPAALAEMRRVLTPGRPAVVHRAWALTRSRSQPVAGQAHAALGSHRGRVSSEPSHRRAPGRHGFPRAHVGQRLRRRS